MPSSEISTGNKRFYERRIDKPIEKLKKKKMEYLRTEPAKNVSKPEMLAECASEMERYHGYMWQVFNEDAQTPIAKYAIRNNLKVLRLSDALLRMVIENRWMYQHDRELKELRRLGSGGDRLAPLWDRANHLLVLLKEKRFAKYEDDFGDEVEDYLRSLLVNQWTKLAQDKTKKMRTLRKQMFYVDHEAVEIENWKREYHEHSLEIERYTCLCLDMVLPVIGDRAWANFEEYVATLE